MDPSQQLKNGLNHSQSVELEPLEPLGIKEVSIPKPKCAPSPVTATPSTCNTTICPPEDNQFESISLLSMNDNSTISSFQDVRRYAVEVLNQCNPTPPGRRKSASDLISEPDSRVVLSQAQRTQKLLPQRNSVVDMRTLKGRRPSLTRRTPSASSLTLSPTPTALKSLKKRRSMPQRAYSSDSINTEPVFSDRIGVYQRRASTDRRMQLNRSLGSLLDDHDGDLASSFVAQNSRFRVAGGAKKPSIGHGQLIRNDLIRHQNTIEMLIGETRLAVGDISKTAKPPSDSISDDNSGFWSLSETRTRSPTPKKIISGPFMAKEMQTQDLDLKQQLAEKDIMIQMLAQQLEGARALQEKEKIIQMLSQQLQELKASNDSARKSRTSDVKEKRKSKSLNSSKKSKSMTDLGLNEVENTSAGRPRRQRTSKIIKDPVAKKKKAKSLRSKSPLRYFQEENSLASSDPKKEVKPKITRRAKSLRTSKSKGEKRVTKTSRRKPCE